MKKITIKAIEFVNFQALAVSLKMLFTYKVKAGQIEITAPESELAVIGY